MALGPLMFQPGHVPFAFVIVRVLLGRGGVVLGAVPLPEYTGKAAQKHQHESGQQSCHHRFAVAPADDALPGPNRPGANRFAGAKAPEVVGQCSRRGIAPVGLFLQTL